MAQLTALAAGLFGAGRMGLDEALERYLQNLVERGLAAQTVRSYRLELTRFVGFLRARGQSEAAQAERSDVVDYLALAGPTHAPVSPGTRNRKFIVLRGLYGFLSAHGAIARLPTEDIPWHREPRQEQPTLRPRDVQQLVSAARRGRGRLVSARDAAIVTVLFHVGLRVGELVALDLDQLDLRQGILLRVKRKGGLEMPLPLNRAATTALREWLTIRATALGGSPAVFVARGGQRLSRRSVEARIAVLGERAGLVFHIHPHLLRHSFATELLRTGSNLEVARRLLGHASVTTTSRYAHPDQTALRGAVDKLTPGKRQRGKGEEESS